MGEIRRATEVRRVELTDAALRIIATKGIAALTTRSLAAEVGLTSGALFRHFASLDALLDAVVGRVEAVLDATFPPDDLEPLERLERFVTARTSAVGNQRGILRLVLSEQFQLALPAQGSERLTACVARTRRFIVACIRDGQARGSIRDDLPAAALAPIVMGTVQMLALSTAEARDRESEAGAVLRGLLALLRAPASPSTRRRSP